MSSPIPPPSALREAPQLAALAVLDAALLTAEATLLAHHTELEDLDALLRGERPLPDGCLAPILLAHFDELHYLLGRYQLAVHDAALLRTDDPIPF
jgi:hypothetical protein